MTASKYSLCDLVDVWIAGETDGFSGYSSVADIVLRQTSNAATHERTMAFDPIKALADYSDAECSVQFWASTVANSSWLRAILWAFTLAMREQTIEALGSKLSANPVLSRPQ